MICNALREVAQKGGLNVVYGSAYGMLNGCRVMITGGKDYQRISIYVGAQEAPMPGYAESYTVSCAQQIIHAISVASGEENIYALMTGNEALPALVLNHAGSVVTVNFPVSPEADAGAVRFVNEVLPQIAPLTRPQQCIYCGQPTGGEGCPVRLSADTVVPMHDACLQQAAVNHRSQSDALGNHRGLPGAMIGAAAGMILWMLLYRFGVVASIVCVLTSLLAILGYNLLKGRPGNRRTVTIMICSLAAVLIGSFAGSILPYLERYFRLGEATRTMFSELSNGLPAWFTYIRASIQTPESSYWPELGVNLLAGIAFAAVGWLVLLRRDPFATAEASCPRRLKGKA